MATLPNQPSLRFASAFALTSAFSLTLYTVGFAGHVVITRALGVEGRGVYAVLITSAMVIALVASAGLGAASTVMAARARAFGGEVFLASSVVGVALSALATFAAIIVPAEALDALFPGVARPLVVAATLVAAFVVVSGYAQSILLGMQRLVPYGLVPVLFALAGLPLYVLALVHFQQGVAGFVAVWVLLAFGSLIAYLLTLFNLGVLPARLNLVWVRELMPIGGRALTASVLNALVLRIDVFLVTTLIGLQGLGYYSVATGVAELLLRLPQVAGTLVFPRSAEAAADAATSIAQISRFVLAVSLTAGLILALGAPFLVTMLYTDAFRPASAVLIVLLPGTAAQALSSPVANALAGLGYPRGYLSAHLVALVLNVGLNVILLPQVGIIGAAIASTAAYIVSCSILLGALSRKSSLPIASYLVPTRADVLLVQSALRTVFAAALLRRKRRTWRG